MSEPKKISVSEATQAFQCLQRRVDSVLEFLSGLDAALEIELADDNPIVNELQLKIGPIPIPECPPIPVLTQGMCKPVVGNVCAREDQS